MSSSWSEGVNDFENYLLREVDDFLHLITARALSLAPKIPLTIINNGFSYGDQLPIRVTLLTLEDLVKTDFFINSLEDLKWVKEVVESLFESLGKPYLNFFI